jgi:hypothetical protein
MKNGRDELFGHHTGNLTVRVIASYPVRRDFTSPYSYAFIYDAVYSGALQNVIPRGTIKNIRRRKVAKYPLDQRRSSSKLFQAMREGEKQPYCASINRISPSVVLAPGGHFGLGRRGHTVSRHGIWHCDDRSSAG